MSDYIIEITLLSDTTLGRGVGLAGEVDVEVEHDALGLPYLHGRGVKGLLRAAGEELADMPAISGHSNFQSTCNALLGRTTDNATESGLLHIGSAQVGDEALRQTLKEANVPRADVLKAFTRVRRQTSIDKDTGAAEEHTLRSLRVLRRGLTLRARVLAGGDLSDEQKGALAAMVAGIQRIGTRRNRGLGKVQTDLLDAAGKSLLTEWLVLFEKVVLA